MYDDFPPVDYFKNVLQNCPQAALLYTSLWKVKSKLHRVSVKKKEIIKRFFISPTLFKNHISSLGRLDLLMYEEINDDEAGDLFHVQLVPSNENK